jgi:predicted permease
MDFSSLRFGVVPLADYIVGPPRQALVLLMAAVGVVLLLACANVAGLLLARGAARTHEIALRAALGATRGAIAREQLVESAVLACAGAALGVALAAAGLRTMIAWSPVDIPRLDATRLDWTVLGFAVLITLMAVAVVGFFPAWQARRLSFSDNLRGPSSGSTSSAAQARTRSALVSFEVGVTLVLVMAAALCVQSFIHLSRVDLGFDPAHVLTFSIRGLGRTRFPTRAQQNEAVENVLASIERVPQVTAAGGVFLRPFELGPVGMDTGFVREGQPDTLDTQVRNPGLAWEAVTPGYFRSMGIRLVHGRNFGPDDTDRSPLVVIVSEAMAARVWPGQDPIGKRLRAYGAGDTTPPRWQTVIGVVATARYREIDTPRLDLYVPLRQSPDNIRFFTVRTGIHPERLLPTLRSELARLDPAFTIDEVATMAQIVAKAQGPWRFDMLIFGLFGVAALGFTVIGLFGLIAYLASQRRREIAVRVALGATRSNIVGIVVLHGLRPMLAGLSLGIPCVWLATLLLSRLLYGVGALDVGTFVISVVILLAAGAFAGYLPARGAARMDPAIVLRSE